MFPVRVITLVAVDVAPLAWHRIARFGMTCLLNTMRVFNVINGLLLAKRDDLRAGTRVVKYADCIPLFHLGPGLTPMLEVALTQVWPS